MKALNLVFFVILLCSSTACKQSRTKQGLVDRAVELESSAMYLDPASFEKTIDGKETGLYKLSNANGMEVYITNFGAVIVAILAPDRDGNMDDIASCPSMRRIITTSYMAAKRDLVNLSGTSMPYPAIPSY
jgi:hypothetical protein